LYWVIGKLRIAVENDCVDEYVKAAACRMNVGVEKIKYVKTLSKSLDISDKEQFYREVSIVVSAPDDYSNAGNFPEYIEQFKPARKMPAGGIRPIIIGFGPAGMFAALELVERGIAPLIFERGKKIEERSIDIQRFIDERVLNPESNIQFGEGGAGSYSDGKLFSRANNSRYVSAVLDTFVKFGAPEEITYASKPHLGTDVLCGIVRNIRNYILRKGGEIHYGAKMTDILITDGMATGVVIGGRDEYRSACIFLAVGHSARDTFEMIYRKGIGIEQRPISVGVRIEHPSEIINLMRHGEKYRNFPGIGAATYSFANTDRKAGRGVYTFCMCPGGEVVNASSEHGMIVVNGMSNSRRESAFSNAAIVVTCHTNDYDSNHPLSGIEFQKDIEKRAFIAGGERWKVPAQNLADFMSNRISDNLNKNSCKTGVAPADMYGIFPKFVCEALFNAFNTWKEKYPLFISEHAILLAPETRTTCPLRIQRSQAYESINTKNLYPVGEGAGYSGGITSSSADAIKAVEKWINFGDVVSHYA